MNIRELIEALEDCEAQVGEDAEVRLMTQEHWPFEYSIKSILTREEIAEDEVLKEGDGHETDVFIVEGSQIRYGSKKAWY